MNEGLGPVTLLALLPLVGSIVVAFLPRADPQLAKRVALGFALGTLALGVWLAIQFNTGVGGYQMVESVDWIPALGVSWTVGLDGIGLILVLLSVLLVPVVMAAGWNERSEISSRSAATREPVAAGVRSGSGGQPTGYGALEHDATASGGGAPEGSVKGYLALILVAEAMMIGVFTALDVFVFYVFFEAILIPLYFMIGRYGSGQRAYAAVKFLIYSLVGGLIMLAALAGLWAISADSEGGPDLSISALADLDISSTAQSWLFLGFFIAFAIKAPLVPVHTWLPDAAGAARPTTAVLMIGVLDKIGTFGMLRLCLPLFPDAAQRFAPVIIGLSVLSILYGALLAIGQTDMRRLFAYVSISHFGFITLGIFAFTTQAMTGATFYMLGHGLSTALLFCVAGYLMSRRGSAQIADYGGVNQVAPVLAGMFLIAGLTALALPGLSTFISEFLVLVGTFTRYPWVAVVATLGIILAALYVLWLYQRTMTGPVASGVEGMRDLNVRELAALAPVIAIVILLGFYPKPALDVINPTVEELQRSIGVSDPEPTVLVPEGAGR